MIVICNFLLINSPHPPVAPQPPMGDGNQGGHAEVPQPYEPQCVWGGRDGPGSGQPGPSP